MAEESVRKELDALKADIAQLRDDIASLTAAMKTVASDKVSDAKARAEQRVRGAWEDVEQKLDEALNTGRQTVDNVQQQIGQHPGGSLLAAFGLGFIIAKLLDGGRR